MYKHSSNNCTAKTFYILTIQTIKAIVYKTSRVLRIQERPWFPKAFHKQQQTKKPRKDRILSEGYLLTLFNEFIFTGETI